MLTLNDIINITFRKSNFSGYKAEDVDEFVDQVRDSYESILKKNIEQKEANESLKAENIQLQKKIEVLAAKVEDYRNEEDEIKNALVSAQKLADASVRDARHKSEVLIKDANLKAERIIANAKNSVVEQQQEFDQLKKTISDFRAKLINTYKQHLTLIDALPTQKPEQPVHENTETGNTFAKQEPISGESAEEMQDSYKHEFSNDSNENVSQTEPESILEEAADDNAEVKDAYAPDMDKTQHFSLNVEGFESQQNQNGSQNGHDLRYDVLKFGDTYDISDDDDDSPVGIFNHNK